MKKGERIAQENYWTENRYDEEEKLKVVRGGSWNYFQDYARCAARDRTSPDIWDSDIGFCCVGTK